MVRLGASRILLTQPTPFNTPGSRARTWINLAANGIGEPDDRTAVVGHSLGHVGAL